VPLLSFRAEIALSQASAHRSARRVLNSAGHRAISLTTVNIHAVRETLGGVKREISRRCLRFKTLGCRSAGGAPAQRDPLCSKCQQWSDASSRLAEPHLQDAAYHLRFAAQEWHSVRQPARTTSANRVSGRQRHVAVNRLACRCVQPDCCGALIG